MNNQIIISIGREFGSRGHFIAEKLAERLNIKLYDKNFLEEVAKEHGLDHDTLVSYEEKPKSTFLYRRVRNYSNSMEENLAQLQFDYLRKCADSGESFIIVGRCADAILRDNKAMISVFILGDKEEKLKRVMEHYNLNEADALDMMKRQDKLRKQYHNQYSEYRWGDSRGYDISINSSRTGLDETVDLLVQYINIRTGSTY